MSHQQVFTLLTTDTALTGLGMTPQSVFGAATAESPEMRPFAVIKWGSDTPFIGSVSSESLELWVYDEPGSFVEINKIIARARQVLCEENVDIVGVDGSRFSTASWRGTSRELYDDIYKCNTRFATFDVV